MSGTVQMRKFSPIDSVSYKYKGTYYLINVCALLAFVGIIIKVVFSSLKIGDEQGPAFSTLVGYVFTTVALFGLLMGVVSYYFKVMNTPSCSNIYPSFFQIIGLIVILFVIIRQSTVFSKMINTQQVDPEFYKFSGYSSLLILIQLMLIFSYLQNNLGCMNSSTTAISSPSLGTLYLSITLFILNVLTVGIMEVILRLFSTCF